MGRGKTAQKYPVKRPNPTDLRWRAMLMLTAWCCATAYAGVGDPAKVDGSLLSGRSFSMEAEHGKVVLVVLWATWCPICRRELPKLEKFYAENAAKGFDIVALSVDETQQKVRDYTSKNQFSFAIGWRNQFKDNLGRVDGTPTMVLVDRQGIVRARTEGALDDAQWWAIEDEIASKPQKDAHQDSTFFPNLRRRAL
jgi:cytochrome c biogenesis protein CcmG, thiol:disulfide interchange protein DsbE